MKYRWFRSSASVLMVLGGLACGPRAGAQELSAPRIARGDQQAEANVALNDDGAARGAAEDRAAEQANAIVDGRTTELIRQRYPDGAIRIERQVAQDDEGNYFNHGFWREFTQRGQLLAEGEYRMGQRVGDWNRWVNPASHPDLQGPDFNGFQAPYMSSGTFEDGELHGSWLLIDAEQRTIQQIELNHGVRHGLAVWFYPNGERRRQVNYNQGVMDGVAMSWKEDKSIAAEDVYIDGRRRVHNQTYFDNAKTKPKSDEHLLAPRLTPVERDDFWNVKFAGYEPEGAELREGAWATWHPNGLPQMRGEFENDQPVGNMTWWYTNGQIKLQGQFAAGQRDGEWTWWHENGMKATQGAYRSGKAAGVWMWWDAEGQVSRRVDLDQADAKLDEIQE